MGKTGLTEAGVVVALYGAFQVGQSIFATNPIIPQPWGGIIVVALGAGVAILRILAKQKAIELPQDPAGGKG